MGTEVPTANYPSPLQAYSAVVILMLITFTALLDRYLPAIALGPMKTDLGLTDTRISLVQGLAFSLFYCVAGVPMGWLVDHRNRRNLILGAIAAWSGMTIWTGLADSFSELFVARSGVGIAEAILAPAAFSIIADSFPSKRRGRAIGIYFSSLIIGSSASFIIGGALLDYLSRSPLHVPLLGQLAPWRGAFILVALAGFPAILVGLTMREPARIATSEDAGRARLLPFLRANAAPMLAIYTTFGIAAFMSVLAVSWGPTLYNRNFNLALPQAAMLVGSALLVGGVLGAWASGVMSDRWNRRHSTGRFSVQLTSIIISMPLVILWPIVPILAASITLFVFAAFSVAFGISSIAATIQDIAPGELRGQLIAGNQIVMTLASGIAPTVVALLTDQLFRDPIALPWSMALVGGLSGLAGVIVSLRAVKPYRQLRDSLRSS